MMATPPLLQRMLEIKVGELVVRRDRIVEPRTGCRVAFGFPDQNSAIAAATEMNEVADWFGVIKTRAEDRKPNCQPELERIAEAHGGRLAKSEDTISERRCAAVVARQESQKESGL